MSIKTTVSLSAAALAALTLLTPMSASAQRGGGGGQPGGSYIQTCSDARVDGGRLYAECRTGNGRESRYSSIEYGRCAGDISNSQGLLACNGAQARLENRGGGNGGGNNGGGWNNRQPDGSYTRSCESIRVDSGRLYAQCRDTRGERRSTSIEFGQCRGDISNSNGLLACNGALGRFERDDRPGNGGGNGGGNNGGGWGGGNGPGNGGPGGGWGGRNSITVYEDANFRGGSATFNGEMPNLGRRQLNDNISSMQMNGSWEACSDPYFRGTCQTFTGDVRNLNNTLLNDRISSLRPVRGW